MINFEKKVLDNGLRVILAPLKSTEAVTLMAFVKVGSRWEVKKIGGISHFLEHMFFKGTKSRPEPGQVHRDLNKIGADHNAFTSKEMTGFWVKTSAKDFDVGLDVVSDILLEPLFKEEEIEKERGVILQEMDMYEDNLRVKVQSVLENIALGDQPIGWDIIGSKESVGAIKRNDLIKYEGENYKAGNMVLVVAGNFEPEETFKKLNAIFGKIKKGTNNPCAKAKIGQKSPNVKIINKDSDQTHLAMAARAYDMYDEKRYVLNLLSVILGGNTSSRLFSEIREKLGLAYYVYSWGEQYLDCGYLGMAAGIPHNKLGEVAEKITDICKEIKDGKISEEDVSLAKSYLRGQMALKFETSDEIAGFVAGQELFYNKIEQPTDIFKKIEKVTKEEIINAAREIFSPSKISLAAVGKQDAGKAEQKRYEAILAKLN
ncbi:MAG: insulinase family protein [Candidatus Pacebacteria bacterium]|nr:insulinase family protein [Candidatus Paceibacterota bacterium]NUQ57002.1 insulinase family protein [Candidatus Paceibacter sp.]